MREQPILAPSEVNDALPDELDPIVLRALARERSARFQSAGELADALDEVLVGKRVGMKQARDVMARLFPEGPPALSDLKPLEAHGAEESSAPRSGSGAKPGTLTSAAMTGQHSASVAMRPGLPVAAWLGVGLGVVGAAVLLAVLWSAGALWPEEMDVHPAAFRWKGATTRCAWRSKWPATRPARRCFWTASARATPR